MLREHEAIFACARQAIYRASGMPAFHKIAYTLFCHVILSAYELDSRLDSLQVDQDRLRRLARERVTREAHYGDGIA